MKNHIHWLTPILISSLILGTVWYVSDPEAYSYYPKGISDRLYTIFTVIIFSYIIYTIYLLTIHRIFTGKNNRIKAGVEYVIVLSFMILAIASISLFITYFINHRDFSWPELIRNSGLTVPILFVYYLVIRNSWLTDKYNRQTLQLEKIRSNQLETELKYLRAQYHPHFLFNALNAVYFQIDEQNTNAKNTIELLSELLRYQLYNMEKKVDISEEINFIKSYIRFQQLRMTKRLAITSYFDEALDEQKIYPLIYQPFLENAFKYVGGEYRINLQLKLVEDKIILILDNSLPENVRQEKESISGIGIENIKRRLALLYPDRHQLNINRDKKSFIVELIINPDSDGN